MAGEGIGPYRKRFTESRLSEDVSEYFSKKIRSAEANRDVLPPNPNPERPDNPIEIANFQNDDMEISAEDGQQFPAGEIVDEEEENVTDGIIFPSAKEADISDGENEFFMPESVLYDTDNFSYSEGKKKPKNLKELLTDPTFLNIIDTPVKASPVEIVFMILKLGVSLKLPVSSISKLMALVNQIFEKPVLPIESRYMIDKFFNDKNKTEFHVTCPKCGNHVGKLQDLDDNCQCPDCGELVSTTESADNLIAILDPSEAIVNLIEHHEQYYSEVLSKNIQEVDSMKDVYDGKKYREFVKSLPEEEKFSYVTAIINSDGAQPFEKSPRSLWPLYIMINEIPVKDRFDSIIPCALWFNRKKPNFSIFLDLFGDVVRKIQNNPLQCIIAGKERLIKLHILVCCVDTVARASMQGSTQFNGRFGCDWCLHPTEYIISTKYPINEKIPPYKKRNHQDTVNAMYALNRQRKNIEGIRNMSPLIFLENFDIIDGFVPDYMHNMLLGAGKQVTNKLIKPSEIQEYQQLIDNIKLPHQVCRLTRPLADNKYWNAREWENWILYISPVIFSKKLPVKYQEYWSRFVQSLYLLLKSEISETDLNDAESMLKTFVLETQQFFTKSIMTYNIHQLLHITDSVRNWGPLWAHSAFTFEAGNHHLMKAIHCGKGAILQILRFININSNVGMIENHLFRNESLIAKTFCINTLTSRVRKCYKINNRTYFGKENVVEEDIRERFHLSSTTCYYNRMIQDGCLFVSFLKQNRRSDNSVALLHNNSYVQIEKFIVDSATNVELIKCRRFNLATVNSFFNCTNLKRILPSTYNNNTEFLSTSLIKSICVHFKVEETEIVCSTPNLYYY